ncbi:aspartate/glutamate racemase family protein [Nitratireductor sp. XY-223]|uniref:aspartate/glutamate racemase family protein n=1 Tax=Nitratireductor sp. XY-223 TaxID=2561926 RepID=UPI00197E58BB|nr:aspartate/glutamate racemase family protein [Nitratireductor sp. XY-223]
MIVSGGKSVYGASIGILMLEARFPRIPGDMGHAATWPFPVRYKVVRGASPDRVVLHNAEGLLEPFIEAAQVLVADGCDGITTNCGFLSLFQEELAGSVGVPVAASSLMQAPLIEAMLPPGRRVGIITISAGTLSEAHLRSAGVDTDTPIVGTDGGEEFSRVILGNEAELDVEAARRDLVNAGRELMLDHPEVGAVLLECTNMMPYAADIAKEIGRPVFTMESFVSWFQGALAPRRYPLDQAPGGV